MTMTEQARHTARTRRKRRRSCEWCGDQIVPSWGQMAVAMGYGTRARRIDTRFCSPSCRQQSYNARRYYSWTIDGETLTGQQLVDRGWTLASREGEHKHSRRRIVALQPGQEPHPLAEMRPYVPRARKSSTT
jgi:hypothetical protein